jgi:hypothetical protein
MTFIVGLMGRLFKNAVVTHAAGALLAGGIAAGAAWILIPGSDGPAPFTATTRKDLNQAVRAAKTRIVAAGYVLSDIDADFIKSQHDRLPYFDAIVVMVDPLGAGGPNRVMCQRQRDEDGDTTSYSNYSRVLNKLREFRSPAKTGKLLGNQLKVGIIDMYPTLGVILVDDDLYVYFYTYNGGGNSPVIKFDNYVHTKDKRGEYFDDYLNKVTWYRDQVGVRKTKFLLTDKDWIPYETADNNQPCTAKQ